MNIRRYVYGWAMWVRCFRMMRAKKHGAGKAKLIHAIRCAACYRSVVDGQFRDPPVFPAYLRRWSR